MKRALVAALATLVLTPVLAGCSTAGDRKTNIYGSPIGQKVVGNKNGVIIENVWDEVDAFPVAEAFCLQHGRSAQFKSSQGYRAAFDCVA